MEDDLEKLEDLEEIRGKLRLPTDLKPCVADLIKKAIPVNGLTPFVIACELQRIGTKQIKIEVILTKLSIIPSKTKGIIKSLRSRKYSYGCVALERMGLCLYKSRFKCWWYKKIPGQNQKKHRERDFWRFGWTTKLTAAEGIIYLAIAEIEKKRRVYAGAWLYISRKELARVSGRNIKTIIPCLEELKEKGLIKFKKGTQHRWYGKASEVKRIIPIPKIIDNEEKKEERPE